MNKVFQNDISKIYIWKLRINIKNKTIYKKYYKNDN